MMATARQVLVAAAVGLVLAAVASGCSSDDHKAHAGKRISTAQLVRYQEPDDTGPHPFTDRVDVRGDYRVELPASGTTASAGLGGGAGGGGTGPSGAGTPGSGTPGSGTPGSSSGGPPPGPSPGPKVSGHVCDRYLLVKFLKHHPTRRRAWAGVLNINPKYKEVRNFIRGLHPVWLARDTLVTAHTFASGRLAANPTILTTGTPVLFDNKNRPVTNCPGGNPLTQPRSTPPTVATPVPNCFNCPAHYRLPPQCPFWSHAYNFLGKLYDHPPYDPMRYDEIFVDYVKKRSFPFRSCYVPYPHPPLALTFTEYLVEPKPAPTPAPTYTPPTYTPPPQEPPPETTQTETTPTEPPPACEPEHCSP